MHIEFDVSVNFDSIITFSTTRLNVCIRIVINYLLKLSLCTKSYVRSQSRNITDIMSINIIVFPKISVCVFMFLWDLPYELWASDKLNSFRFRLEKKKIPPKNKIFLFNFFLLIFFFLIYLKVKKLFSNLVKCAVSNILIINYSIFKKKFFFVFFFLFDS
jgi:hypothetical protein